MYYLYRFVNVNNDIIYIGRTNDIKRRILKEHFTDNTHLPKECYLDTQKVDYTEINYESEEVAYEAVLINHYRPKYNIQFKDDGVFDINLPKFEWKSFEWEYKGQFEFLKKKKMDTINIIDIIGHYFAQDISVIVTGINGIDSCYPILPRSFTLVAGVSGIGKTTYMLNIALRNAKSNKKVLFINLKDTEENLSMRLLSINGHIPLKNLITKEMTAENWGTLMENAKEFARLDFSIYNKNTDYFNLEKILSNILESHADLVIVDDLQMIEHERNNYVKDRMEYVLKSIRAIALQTYIPVIGSYCIPLKKNQIRSDNKRPLLEDLEYDSLIRYVDNIHFLYRDSFYYHDTDDAETTEIIVAKNMTDEKAHTLYVCHVNGLIMDFPYIKP